MTGEALGLVIGAAAVALTCIGMLARAMFTSGRQVERLEAIASDVHDGREDIREVRGSVSRLHGRVDTLGQEVAGLKGENRGRRQRMEP